MGMPTQGDKLPLPQKKRSTHSLYTSDLAYKVQVRKDNFVGFFDNGPLEYYITQLYSRAASLAMELNQPILVVVCEAQENNSRWF